MGKKISVDEEKIRTLLKVLVQAEYEFVTTDNLFATDRPDLISDPKKIMFCISFTNILETVREAIAELEKFDDIQKADYPVCVH